MRQVKEIVEDQTVAAPGFDRPTMGYPIVVEQPGLEVRHQRRIGALGNTHPDEHPAQLLRRGIGPDPSPGRHLLLAGDVHAAAVPAEDQSVIAAFQPITVTPSGRKRQISMRAAVLERDGYSVLGAEQNHHLAENDPAEQSLA